MLTNENRGTSQVRIQYLCKVGRGPKRDFADIARRSRGSGKNLGLQIGGALEPPPPDPHLLPHIVEMDPKDILVTCV